MYALSTIVNAYNNSYVPKNFISLPERDQKVFSGDQTLLFSYSSYLLEVYDTAYGRVQYTFEPCSFARRHTELAEKYSGLESLAISDIAPTEGGKFIVASSVCVFELDIDDNSYFKYIAPRGSDLYYKNGKVAVCSMGSVAVYDCATGEVLYENDFNSASGESSVTYLIKDLCWNEDASLFAIGLDYSNNAIQTGLSRNDPELNRQENEYFRNNPAIGLAVVDLATGELTKLSGQRTVEVSFAGSAVGAAHMEYPSYNVACNNAGVTSTPARWFAGVYDLGSGECSYQSDMLLGETYNSFGFSKGSITIDGNVRPVYELWIGKTGIILDAEKRAFVDSIKVARGSKIALLGDKTELIAAREEALLLYDLQTGELTSQLDVPYTISEIITDSGNDAFAVYVGGGYSSENDNGWFLGGWYLISVDENRDIYLTAFISRTSAYGSISPSGGEIISGSASESFEFMRVLSFEELVRKASLLK